jgi:hypothetical protein
MADSIGLVQASAVLAPKVCSTGLPHTVCAFCWARWSLAVDGSISDAYCGFLVERDLFRRTRLVRVIAFCIFVAAGATRHHAVVRRMSAALTRAASQMRTADSWLKEIYSEGPGSCV